MKIVTLFLSYLSLQIRVNSGFMIPSTNQILMVEIAHSGSLSKSPFLNQQRTSIKNKLSIKNEETIESSSKKQNLGNPICDYHTVTIPSTKPGPPCQAINVEDLTLTIQSLLAESKMSQGVINIISRHTTTAITINERESRLAQDMEKYFLSLAPPDERSSADTAKKSVRYFHNDINMRPDSVEESQRCKENGWDVDDPAQLDAWRAQEPINAHSHLLSMLLGSSESIPVVDGKMVIGQWQSILLVDLDGPRERTVGVQFMGYQ